MFNFFAAVLILLLVGLIGWHVFLALAGGAVVVAGSAWIFLVITVSILCASILLPFIFAGVVVLIFGVVVGIWTLIALVLFPILFPVLIPLFLLFWFVAYAMKKHRKLD
jgi:hypothetical protein